MNLINKFALIKKLFARREGKTIHLVELNDHLRRDIGLDNVNAAGRVRKEALPKKEIIVHGHLTRAP